MHHHRHLVDVCYGVQLLVLLVVGTAMWRRGYSGLMDGQQDVTWKRIRNIGVAVWGLTQIVMGIALFD